MKFDTLLVIPAYNEEVMISQVLIGINSIKPDFDIIVIDDGSNDKTAEKVRELNQKLILHPFNLGYGAALQTGYKYAKRKNYRYVIQMDADGQHDPLEIRKLLFEIKKDSSDLIIGSRFLGEENYIPSLPKKLGLKIFQNIFYLLSGKKIMDLTSGFQAMNKKVIHLFTQEIFPTDYPDADILLLIIQSGLKVNEISVKMFPNSTGKSMHQKLPNIIYYIFKMLLSLFLTKMRKIR